MEIKYQTQRREDTQFSSLLKILIYCRSYVLFLHAYVAVWKAQAKKTDFWGGGRGLPTTWTLTFKPTALEHCAEHVPAQYYNHQLMCASDLAAISTTVCQVGVFENNLKSYSERDQTWLTATSTSMKQACCVFNDSLTWGNWWLVETTNRMWVHHRHTADLWSIFFALRAHLCTEVATATESKI